MHTDMEAELLADGSNRTDLWGFCIHFYALGDDPLEFVSHINIRPEDGNTSVMIKSPVTQAAIRELVARRIDWEH